MKRAKFIHADIDRNDPIAGRAIVTDRQNIGDRLSQESFPSLSAFGMRAGMIARNTFGFPLRTRTIFDLYDLGITDWAGLDALSDRDRNLLFGWGAATDRRFQAVRQSNLLAGGVELRNRDGG